MNAIDIIKLVAEGGSIMLLASVLYGIFRLTRDFVPSFLAAWGEHTKAIVANTSKLNEVHAAVNAARERASAASEDMAELKGHVTGQHVAVAVAPPESSSSRRRS